MSVPRIFLIVALALAFSVSASEPAPAAGAQVGDCAIFREGGSGRILKAPTFWLKGTIMALSPERRVAGRCPQMGKPLAAYTRDDWRRIAASTPCVHSDAEVREVDVLRIQLRVDEWETPWSHSHGTSGWLFRGYFLDQELKNGMIIDMDAAWLERCVPRPSVTARDAM